MHVCQARQALRRLLTFAFMLPYVVSVEQNCAHRELTRCARPLQVLSDTSDMHFVSNKAELDKLCPDLEKGLQCIQSYTRRCMNDTQRVHFKRLYKGTGEAVKDLCTEGPYQTQFLSHAPCLKQIRPEYENCAANHLNTIGNLSANGSTGGPSTEMKFCCSFSSYINCSENAVRKQCGDESAIFTKEFLFKVSDAIIKSYCKKYFEGHQCQSRIFDYNRSSSLAPALATLLFPVVLSLAVLLNTPTNSSRIIAN